MSLVRTITTSVGALCFSALVFSQASLAEPEVFTAEDVSQILDYLQDPQPQKLTEKKIACGAKYVIAEVNKTMTVKVTKRIRADNYSQTKEACEQSATPNLIAQLCRDNLTRIGNEGKQGFRENECVQELKKIKSAVTCDQTIPTACDPVQFRATQHCKKFEDEELKCAVTDASAANPIGEFAGCFSATISRETIWMVDANCTVDVTYTYSGDGVVGCTDCPR